MLSKIRNLKGTTGFLAGLLVAMLVVPSVAVAAGLKFTGIEGTSGNKADVTGNSELMTTGFNPADIFQSQQLFVDSSGSTRLVYPGGSNQAMLVDEVHVSVESVESADSSFFQIWINAGATCDSADELWSYAVNPATSGEIDIPFDPGIPLKNEYSLCATASDVAIIGSMQVSGEYVPSAELTGYAF